MAACWIACTGRAGSAVAPPTLRKGANMPLPRRLVPPMLVAAAALTAVSLAACGGGSTTSSTSPNASGGTTATVEVANSSLGNILVDSQGRTLYLFKKDFGPKSTCFGA